MTRLFLRAPATHLGKIDRMPERILRSLKAPRQRVQTRSAWSVYSLLKACSRRIILGMIKRTICRIAMKLNYVVLRVALHPDLPELIQIAMAFYDFVCLFFPCLPQIPGL